MPDTRRFRSRAGHERPIYSGRLSRGSLDPRQSWSPRQVCEMLASMPRVRAAGTAPRSPRRLRVAAIRAGASPLASVEQPQPPSARARATLPPLPRSRPERSVRGSCRNPLCRWTADRGQSTGGAHALRGDRLRLPGQHGPRKANRPLNAARPDGDPEPGGAGANFEPDPNHLDLLLRPGRIFANGPYTRCYVAVMPLYHRKRTDLAVVSWGSAQITAKTSRVPA